MTEYYKSARAKRAQTFNISSIMRCIAVYTGRQCAHPTELWFSLYPEPAPAVPGKLQCLPALQPVQYAAFGNNYAIYINSYAIYTG